MSFTRTVPATVPSVRHSSGSADGLLTKNNVSPDRVSEDGFIPAVSLRVPADVPSVTHNCGSLSELSLAVKNVRLLTTTRLAGADPSLRVLMSRIMTSGESGVVTAT